MTPDADPERPGPLPRRPADHPRADQAAQDQRRGVPEDRAAPRSNADVHGARRLQRDVERALFVQVVAHSPATLADERAARDSRAGRERRRGRHRRRVRGRLQDGVAQPPELHRAVPRGGDGRGRDHARRVHHGRTPRSPASTRSASVAPITRARPSSCAASSPASAGTATASACRRSAAKCSSTSLVRREHPGQRLHVRRGADRSDFLRHARAASATRSCTSARRPVATASTARRWPATSSRPAGPSQRPTMQVGDPFMGKLLLEACLELFSMRRARRDSRHGGRRAHVVERGDGGARRRTASSSISTAFRGAPRG